MEELSIEEKAKAYDKALERTKSWAKGEHPECFTEAQKAAEFIFPELKEDEDEKIRKELIQYIKNWKANIQGKAYTYLWSSDKEECNKLLAWLEKQDGKYSGGTSKEWTINDAAILKELIDFLENGTAKLQHDLTLYANWLKIQFTQVEKKSEKKSIWSEKDDGYKLVALSAFLNYYDEENPLRKCLINWLNSLKQRMGG